MKNKPIIVKGNPFGPMQATERHLKKYGHLPTTDLCDEKGSCIKKKGKLRLNKQIESFLLWKQLKDQFVKYLVINTLIPCRQIVGV